MATYMEKQWNDLRKRAKKETAARGHKLGRFTKQCQTGTFPKFIFTSRAACVCGMSVEIQQEDSSVFYAEGMSKAMRANCRARHVSSHGSKKQSPVSFRNSATSTA